jgi:hypothetical protein
LIPRYLRRSIRERVAATGEILVCVDDGQSRQALERLRRSEVE